MISLFRFILILIGLIIPYKRETRVTQMPVNNEHFDEGYDNKYNSMIGLNIPLIPTEPLFCPICHVLVAKLRRTKDGVQIIKGNTVLVTVGGNVTVTHDGRVSKGFPIRCSNGHIVEVV